ncbi:MAG: carboxymuconolactone decarboxylase family protein [Gammaproteobacteria bacterium]
MPRLTPLQENELNPSVRDPIQQGRELMGFVSNDAMTMARKPEILSGFLALVEAIYAPGETSSALKRLVGLMTSAGAGCRYCVAHTASSALRFGIAEEKLNQLWEFEASPLYTPAERAALRVALHAAQTPNGVSDKMYADFAACYSEQEQTEIIAVIALFGFLNRWNSTLATDLEALPASRTEQLKIKVKAE